MSRRLRPAMVLALALALLGASLVWLAPSGSAAQGRLVSDEPAPWTPDVLGGADTETKKSRVTAIARVGDKVVLGGTFTEVKQGGTAHQRNHILAFDAATGKLTGFAPDVGGRVDALVPAPGGEAVYAGGGFTTVNGQRSKGLALIDLSSGTLVSSFDVPEINGRVRDLALSGGRLYVAGHFGFVGGKPHKRMVTLDPQTGAVDPFFDLPFTGMHEGNFPNVREFDISPSGDRLVALGNFRNVGGERREQLVMIDIGGSSAELADWRTTRYREPCNPVFSTYMRDVAWSPGGSYFVVVTTGGGARSDEALCDTATRWEAGATGSDVEPTWINYTGRDTLTAVEVAGGVVYVGGHQRWLNNPHGADSAGPGAVPRPGLAALDPGNGLPLDWNPGRIPRGYGVTDFFATDRGLWVGSDTEWIGQFRHRRERIAFFPFANGTVVPQATTARLPGDVYLLGGDSLLGGDGQVDYRSYDGQAVTGTGTTDGGDLDESGVHGAALIGGTLWYGSADGELYKRSFDGQSFGSATAPNPHDWPFRQNADKQWPGRKSAFYDELSAVSGMFYADGRLYYTMSGQPQLYYRAFTPSSAIVGAERFTAGTQLDWSGVRGMFRSGGQLYFATADGDLHRVQFRNGAPVSGTSTVVDSEQNWAAQGLFLRHNANAGGGTGGGGEPGGGTQDPGDGTGGDDTGGGDGGSNDPPGGDEDPPATGGGDGDPPATGGGDEDPPATGGGDGDPPANGGGDEDPPATGGGDGDPPANGGGDEDPPATGEPGGTDPGGIVDEIVGDGSEDETGGPNEGNAGGNETPGSDKNEDPQGGNQNGGNGSEPKGNNDPATGEDGKTSTRDHDPGNGTTKDNGGAGREGASGDGGGEAVAENQGPGNGTGGSVTNDQPADESAEDVTYAASGGGGDGESGGLPYTGFELGLLAAVALAALAIGAGCVFLSGGRLRPAGGRVRRNT